MNYEAEITEKLSSSTKAELYNELYNDYLNVENEISYIKNGKIAVCKKKLKAVEASIKEIEDEESQLSGGDDLRVQFLKQVRAAEEEDIKRRFAIKSKETKDKIDEMSKKVEEEKESVKAQELKKEADLFNAYLKHTKELFRLTKAERETLSLATETPESVELAVDYEKYNDSFFENLFKSQKKKQLCFNLYEKGLEVFTTKKNIVNLSLMIFFILVEVLIQLFAAVFMDGVFFKTIILCLAFACTGLAANEMVRYALLDLQEEKSKTSKKAIVDYVILALAVVMLWLSCSFLVSTFKRRLVKGIFGLIFGGVAVFVASAIYTELDTNKLCIPMTPREKKNYVLWCSMLDLTAETDDEVIKILTALSVFKNRETKKDFNVIIKKIMAEDASPVIRNIRDEFYSDALAMEFESGNNLARLNENLRELKEALAGLDSARESEITEVRKNLYTDKVEQKLREHFDAIRKSVEAKNKGKLLKEKEELSSNINSYNAEIDEIKAKVKGLTEKMADLKEIFGKKIDTPVSAKIDNKLPIGFAETGTDVNALVSIEHNMKPVVIKCTEIQAENNGNEMSEIEEFVCHAFWGCVYNNMKETALHLYDESAAFSNLFYDRNVAAASQNRYIVHKIDANDVSRDIAEIIENKSRLTGKIDEYNRLCLNEMRNIIKYDIIFIYGHSKLLNDKDFVRILNNTENWGIVPILIINENLYAENSDSEFIKAAVKNNAVYKLNRSAFADKFVVQQNYIEKIL